MTVAQLRNALRHWPAETPVIIAGGPDGHNEGLLVEVSHRAGRPVALRIILGGRTQDFSPLLDWRTVE